MHSINAHWVLFKSSLFLISIWVHRIQQILRKSCLGQSIDLLLAVLGCFGSCILFNEVILLIQSTLLFKNQHLALNSAALRTHYHSSKWFHCY